MSKLLAGALAFIMLACSLSVGQDATSKSRARQAVKPKGPTVSQQLQQVQDQLDRQQALIKQQQEQINQLQEQLKSNSSQAQQQTQQLQESLQQATEVAAAAREATALKAASLLNASVTDLKASDAAVLSAVEKTQKTVKDLEAPAAIRYKGLKITPGGFLEADFFARTRNENADMSSNFGSTPFNGVANSQLSEFRASARASRISILGESMAGTTKLTGYYEMDFLSQAPTANQVQTNSFNPRQRQLWAQAELNNGLTLTVGQMWSLITTGRKGLATRTEFIPTTIDGGYVVGYNYVRQTAFRVTKKFNDKIWAAFEVANPETNQPNASFVPANLFGFNNSANATSPNGSTINYMAGVTNGFSTNMAPDLLAKAVFEPGWGHYEIKALGRFFRDRMNGKNNVSYGGGLGAAAILPVVAKRADFVVEALAGNGIGRYGAANGTDVTLRPDARIVPLHTAQLMGGIELHPQPKLDLFAYVGDEYYGRAAYTTLDKNGNVIPAGYGSPLVNNTNCGVEVVPSGGAACGAQNKNVWEATTGFYYRFFKGPMGTLQYGMQYEYLGRSTWSGATGVPAGSANGIAPKGLDHVVFSSFRYILP